jgi:TrmH family RNA methyltransferase
VEGPRAVASALDAGAPLVDLVVSTSAQNDTAVQDCLRRASVPVYTTDDDTLDRLADTYSPQGLLAVAETRYADADRLAEVLPAAHTVLALDRVQDPGNVGTLLRTAAWFGADAVVAGSGTAGLYGPKVMRAGAGGHWDLTLARTDDLAGTLGHLQAAGSTCYGADLQGTRAEAWSPPRPSTLVMGSEAHGLRPATQAALDATVALPGSPARRGTESLNVAVAGGILIYEWLQPR